MPDIYNTMPSLNGNRRRHSRQPSSSTNSGPSSALSTVSGESTSSNSTVTPRSIFQSSLRPSKRPGAKKNPIEDLKVTHSRARSTDDTNKENVDVFAFMERDEEDDEHHEHSMDEKAVEASTHMELSSGSVPTASIDLPQMSPRYSDLEVRAIQDGVQRAWGRGSLHSDSGISVRSNSPDADSPVLQHKLPTVFAAPDPEAEIQPPQLKETYGLEISQDPPNDRDPLSDRKRLLPHEAHYAHCPETYYTPLPRALTRSRLGGGASVADVRAKPSSQLVRGTSSHERPQHTTGKSGYEYLASYIDSRDDALLKPIYRKFEMLNNRMLLYLQDEISEMEDQLRELDDAIAHEERTNGTRPASRRAEARLPSQLQWHRLDLLGRSFAKVEQYSKSSQWDYMFQKL